MSRLLAKLKILLGDRGMRRRLLVLLGALVVFRLLAAIPIPGVDTARLSEFLFGNQFFGLFNIFSGGGLSNLSIVMLGVGPYITASIIMQLLSMMIPKVKELYQESGEIGRRTFNQYTRMLSVPFAVLQGLSLLLLFKRQGVLPAMSAFDMAVNVLVVVAGSMLLMWIGELVTEFGIGNGTSVIIFAGIVASIPTQASQFFFTYSVDNLSNIIMFGLVGIAVIAAVVFITEAERPIAITYARQGRTGATGIPGASTYLPLRLNQAGVIPIIFALSILLFPQLLANIFATSSHETLTQIATGINEFLQNTWSYAVVYFLLVIIFTYFYTAITFDPKQIAQNLQRSGAFIPGIRPGEATVAHLSTIVTRITLVGSLFLGLVAVLPVVMRAVTGITALSVGGTALLIVVSVVLDIVKKLDAQIAMHEY